jgi:NAD-dependent SIR2 family protein deacetylase
VLHSLGLDLICADRNVETRWALAALAAAQCRARLAPRTVPDAGSLERVIDLLRTCSRVLVISGAGVSKGVPGFQQYWNSLDASGRGGLPDAMGLFDLSKFVYTPQPFLGYVRHLLSGGFAPSASHQFIRELERRSKLLRNYTQNVDTLEAAAGIERVVHVHGHLGEAACIACRTVVPGALLHL